MKRLALLPLAALAACAPAPAWQVVSVRTSEAQPATETSLARVRIDDHRFTGTTGCTDVTGTFDGDSPITLSGVQVGDPGNCSGWARQTHDQLAPLLVDGAEFRVARPADFELVLVHTGGETIRLMLQ